MNRSKHSALAVGVCLLSAIGVYGQNERPNRVQVGEAAASVNRQVEPDSPATNPTVVSGPQAVVPRLMKFSGSLRDAAGKPLTGTVDVTFALYSAEAGGSPLWFETQSVQADELGRYTALLGAMHADGLPVDLFTSGEVRWLGIQVGSEAEQQPRVLLVSVPYALKAGDAETLGGKPLSAFVLADTKNGAASASTSSESTTSTTQANAAGKNQKSGTANTSAPLTACASVTSNGAAVVNSIAMFTTACNIQSSVLTQYNGNLGFGTTTPAAALHIFGPTKVDSDARFNFILGDSTAAAAGTGGGILFSGYYSGTTLKAGLANIRGVKENATQGDFASALIFDTRVNGGVQSERMRITSLGNVGIGTRTPVAKLDVRGNINIPVAAGAGAGVMTMGGTPFIHACCNSTFPNIFVGASAGDFTNTGTANVGTGWAALSSLTSGSNNTASGFDALAHTSSGGGNAAVGADSLTYNTSGSANVGLGTNAGLSNQTGSHNTFLGGATDLCADGYNYAVAVGFGAIVCENNAIVLGGTGAYAVNVGIGMSAPATSLQVFNGTTSDGIPSADTAIAGSCGGNFCRAIIGDSLAANGIGVQGNATGTAGVGIVGNAPYGSGYAGLFNGNVTISQNLAVTGSVTAASYVTSSSERWKTNIHTLRDGLGKVEQLRGVTYQQKLDGKPQIGVIAEEVARVLPQVVAHDSTGQPSGVDYARLTAVLIEATKEQQREIHAQRRLLHEQQAKIAQLTSQVALIQASLKVPGEKKPTASLAQLFPATKRNESRNAKAARAGF